MILNKFKCGLPKLPLLSPRLWPYYPGVNPFEQMKRGLAVGLALVVSGCAASSQSQAVTTSDPWAAQAEILRRNFDAAVASGSKHSEKVVKIAGEAFAPIQNRVSIAVEKVKQAA